jgi:hypothetical protein
VFSVRLGCVHQLGGIEMAEVMLNELRDVAFPHRSIVEKSERRDKDSRGRRSRENVPRRNRTADA